MISDLRSIVQAVNRASSLDEGLNLAVARVCQVLEVDVCSVYLLDAEHRHCILQANSGLSLGDSESIRMETGEGLVGLVANRGLLLNLEQAREHPNFLAMPGLNEEPMNAFIGVPIVHRRRVVGVLVAQHHESRRFSADEESFLMTLAAQLATTIAHAEVVRTIDRSGGIAEGAVFHGVPGVPGVALGTVVVPTSDVSLQSVPSRKNQDPEAEICLFQGCLREVREEIKSLGQMLGSYLPAAERGLFDAYLRILDNDGLGSEIMDRIRQGEWAEGAVSQIVLAHARNFEQLGDEYLRDRASDIRDLGKRLLRSLRQADRPAREYPDQIILIAEELTPAALGEVPTPRLAGLVSVRGSYSSHVAVLARALGIPTVMGARDLPVVHADGRKAIVDGQRGVVHIDPTDGVWRGYQDVLDEERSVSQDLLDLRDVPCVLKDGHQVALWVNTGLAVDVSRSRESGAEGVGLFRTEMPFMLRDSFPNEAEQLEIYRAHLEAFTPRPVTMRTLDIGGDKSLPYLPIQEENPFLGWRGIRISIDHPELFATQVRAMLRASEGLNNLRIVLPMLSNINELRFALSMIYGVHEELLEQEHQIALPPIGVMVEIPAAVYQARLYARHTDFLSVGSNDLTQYILAVDRNNAQVSDLYQPLHPSVLKALRDVVEAAAAEGKETTICGEVAGDPAAALLLVGMGYRTLSMGAANLLKIKAVLRRFSFAELRGILAEVETMEHAVEIRDHLLQKLHRAGLGRLLGSGYEGL